MFVFLQDGGKDRDGWMSSELSKEGTPIVARFDTLLNQSKKIKRLENIVARFDTLRARDC